MADFGGSSRARLATCHPDLQRVLLEVVRHFDCTVVCGERGKAEQDAAFASGNSKARFGESSHNYSPSLAVDVVPYPVDWKDLDRIRYFAGFVKGVAAAMGVDLVWGGDWNDNTVLSDQKFNDLPHFEIKGWRQVKGVAV